MNRRTFNQATTAAAALSAISQPLQGLAASPPRPDRRIVLASVPNLRQLGGLPVAGGTFVRDKVYRSVDLANLSDADMPKFRSLGVSNLQTEALKLAALGITSLEECADLTGLSQNQPVTCDTCCT